MILAIHSNSHYITIYIYIYIYKYIYIYIFIYIWKTGSFWYVVFVSGLHIKGNIAISVHARQNTS